MAELTGVDPIELHPCPGVAISKGASGLKEYHQQGDHIDHVVTAHGVLPVTPGECNRHG